MNFKTFISLLVAVTLGLAAVWVGRELILGRAPEVVSNTPMTKVVVAKTDLEPGQTLTADDLDLIDMPTNAIPASSFKETKSLVDRALIAPVVKGQVMFDGLLAKEGSSGGLVALVPKGMRAVSVEVNESSGVSGLLIPGCRVDVIATLHQDSNNANGAGQQIARTIVEDAKVQAVGPRMTIKNGDNGTQAAKTVTLIVTTKDAESIELASTFGRPRLVLRGTSDSDRTTSAGVTNSELTGQVTPAGTAPGGETAWDRFLSAVMAHPGAPAQPQRWPVQIIRGNNESTIFYEMKARSSAGSSGDGWVASYPNADHPQEKASDNKDVR